MSIADAIAGGPPRAPRARTKLDAYLETLDERDRDAVEVMLRDRDWKHADVRRILAEHGLEASQVQIARWREDRGVHRVSR
ncbi:putative phosphosugar-binding protein [Microbacterium marinum]|uniref:Putative phosphosugar-binding protein n=1 Tax=Microbacterium marinum TaxID=421115 RepID=A0A7W7FJB0_9MICO|nr:hypothetical protein [Microbacterium marinum]MBB4666968.1 putative phosphosugar-binding protein [Microbacterium marinum]